jgi:hypothetical protein
VVWRNPKTNELKSNTYPFYSLPEEINIKGAFINYGQPMRKLKLISICLLILLFAVLSQGSAQDSSSETFKAGVSSGDNFVYAFNVYWNSQEPNQTPPASVIELNNTKWVTITVHQATGPVVIMNMTTHFKNGTEIKTQIWVNLLNGEGDGFGFIIAPNLGPQHLAYHMGMDRGYSFLLKEELVRNYTFGKRIVLHALVNKTSSDEYVLISHDMYFDKETGVMLEWYITQVPKYAPTTSIMLAWKIMEFHATPGSTSADQNPIIQRTLTLLVVVPIASLLIIMLFYKRKKRRHKS